VEGVICEPVFRQATKWPIIKAAEEIFGREVYKNPVDGVSRKCVNVSSSSRVERHMIGWLGERRTVQAHAGEFYHGYG
jgi:hypothetical protein